MQENENLYRDVAAWDGELSIAGYFIERRFKRLQIDFCMNINPCLQNKLDILALHEFLEKGRLKNEFRCFQTTFGVLISVKHC
ncbi:hypothetical protein HMPREF2726_00680 [Neisseria sp. HMSC074B07]|jgi:hypothetical protein|nr:hypothetical protein HMPREF2726_00680 [Neisseria sp. HMSC074B07]